MPALLALALLLVPQAKTPFQDEIEAYEAQDRTNPPKPGGIVFVGSSSIRLWKTLAQDFPGRNVINRGFGGSQMADSVRYVHRIVTPYAPKMVVVYAGTNDIAGGKSAEAVFGDYQAFVREVRSRLPETKIAYISNSLTPSRQKFWPTMTRANDLIRDWSKTQKGLTYIDIVPYMWDANGFARPELFVADQLHMNEKGYAIWTRVVGPYLPKK